MFETLETQRRTTYLVWNSISQQARVRGGGGAVHAVAATGKVDGGVAGDAPCSAGWGMAQCEIGAGTTQDGVWQGIVTTTRQSGAVDGASRA